MVAAVNKDIRRWIAGGHSVKANAWRTWSKVKIPVPPLEEQRRIAEILDTIDETIQATERVIAKLDSEGPSWLAASLLLCEGRKGDMYALGDK